MAHCKTVKLYLTHNIAQEKRIISPRLTDKTLNGTWQLNAAPHIIHTIDTALCKSFEVL